MNDVGFVYKSSIVLACLVLMLASIACTGWFFYSWLGGMPGIVGACVGCAIQLMAYGFSGVMVHHKGGILKTILAALIFSALSLSALSSYATLTGYFSALQNDKQAQLLSAQQKERAVQAALDQRMKLLDAMSRDIEIASNAADQGLADKYRTQASQFLDNNASTRSELAAQIAEIEKLAQSDLLQAAPESEASPVDGLASVLGGQSMAIIILCAWLAVMFDALPIVGITLLESKAAQRKLAKLLEKEKAKEEKPAFEEVQSETSIAIEKKPISEEARALIEHDAASDKEIDAKAKPKSQHKIITNISSADLQASKRFYIELLDFEVKYEANWYIQFASPHDPDLEFGVIQRNSNLIPDEYRHQPRGMYMTFLVPDVNETYARALELGIDILQEPRNEFYGQRRFLAREPSGCLIDICSPWEEEVLDEDKMADIEDAIDESEEQFASA